MHTISAAHQAEVFRIGGASTLVRFDGDGQQNESLREEDHHQQHESSGDLHAGKKADERDRSTGGDVAGLAQRKKILQIRQAKKQSYQTEQNEAARSRSFSDFGKSVGGDAAKTLIIGGQIDHQRHAGENHAALEAATGRELSVGDGVKTKDEQRPG